MTHFKSAEGRNIRIEMFHLSRTYGGSLEGLPPVRSVIKSRLKQAELLWGKDRPTMLVKPTAEGDRLPEWTVFAWLESDALEDGCGSHLFLVCFVNAVLEYSPNELCRSALGPTEWVKQAQDWWL